MACHVCKRSLFGFHGIGDDPLVLVARLNVGAPSDFSAPLNFDTPGVRLLLRGPLWPAMVTNTGVWCAVCGVRGVWCVLRGVWNVVRGVWCVVRGLRCVVCGVGGVVRGVWTGSVPAILISFRTCLDSCLGKWFKTCFGKPISVGLFFYHPWKK